MRLTAHDIMTVVANTYDLSVADLRGPRRSKQYAHPRMISQWLAVELLSEKSLPQLGRCFGRDHTSIMYSKKRAREIVSHDLEHIAKVNLIIAELRRLASHALA
jgi:chromosomal replication initiator protein